MNKKTMSILMGLLVMMMIVSSSVFAADPYNVDVSIDKVHPNCAGIGDISVGGIFPDVSVCEGKPTDVDIKLTNHESFPVTVKTEVGFYMKEQLEDWGYMSMFSVVSVPNCNPQEIYVRTVEVTLPAGATETHKITIKKAPTVTVTKIYYLTTAVYKECWSPETGSTLSSWDYTKVAVYGADASGIIETCTDGLKNQDETGTDCGGETCKKCGLYSVCNSGDDCTTGYCGSSGKCETPSQPNMVDCEGVMCDMMRETNLSKPVLYGAGGLIFMVFVFLIVMVAKSGKKK